MNNGKSYEELFPNRAIFPVIRVGTSMEVLQAVRVAINAGADGAFFTNHRAFGSAKFNLFLNVVKQVKQRYPDFWVGINTFRSLERDINLLTNEIDGYQLDNSYVRRVEPHTTADYFLELFSESDWKGLYFGGVAFKYTPGVHDRDLVVVADIATQYMDVITTSGLATGKPPRIGKVVSVREGAGSHSVAIASGVSIENVSRFLPYVDAYLVNTSIANEYFSLDPVKTEALVNAIHGWSGEARDLEEIEREEGNIFKFV